MMIDWPTILPLLIGHIALFALILNVTHSTNMPEKLLDVFNVTLLLATLTALPFLVTQGSWTTWPLIPKAYALLCLGTSLAGIPIVTVVRSFRSVPAGIEGRAEELDLASELGTERVVGEGRHHWLLHLPGNQSLKVAKVECELKLPNLPRQLDGLTLVQLTDLHFSHCYRRDFFEAVAEAASLWDADLVAFTGDLLDDVTTIEWVEPVLSRLQGRLGQFAILGNHDHRLRPGRARRALRRAGFTDLEGRWESFEIQGATLALGGTSAPWGPPLDYRTSQESDFRIVLSHSPDQFPQAASAGVGLVLSGHNHGGQIRLPVLGPILMPSRYSRHFDRGFFRSRDEASTLYVSQGVGGKHPIRYGCTPEITRFTLRAIPAARVPHAREQVDAGRIRRW